MVKTRRSPRSTSTAPTGASDPRGATDHLQVADGLARLSRLVEGIHAQVSQDHDLTPVQAKLLCILTFAPTTMSELARCLGVEKAAMTGLIDRAERRGLVTREEVPGDRRALNVVLTEVGRRAGHAFHAQVTAELEGLVAPLSTRERAGFARSLSRIVTATSSTGHWLSPPNMKETS